MSWTLPFASYEETMVERPVSGNHIMASFDETSIVLYTFCTTNDGYLAQSFQPYYLKTNSAKIGQVWELRTTFDASLVASDWGNKKGKDSIIALTIPRDAFEEIVATSLQPKQRENVSFSWEMGADIFGDRCGPNNLVLRVGGELLSHLTRYWILQVLHMSLYTDAAKDFVKNKDSEMIQVPLERVYPLNPELREPLGLQALLYFDLEMDVLHRGKKSNYVPFNMKFNLHKDEFQGTQSPDDGYLE